MNESEMIEAHVQSLVRMIALRDPGTEEHAQRVTSLVLALARLWHLPEQETAHLRHGALLHDLGKVAVPDAILYKPGPLTPNELRLMQMHPVFALDMLADVPELQPALDIPYCHHERWDGKGYPRGLKGEDIPLTARLFSIVDVWDALLSDRPYRAAWSKRKAIAYVRDQSGRQFDPAVVAAFARMLEFDRLEERLAGSRFLLAGARGWVASPAY